MQRSHFKKIICFVFGKEHINYYLNLRKCYQVWARMSHPSKMYYMHFRQATVASISPHLQFGGNKHWTTIQSHLYALLRWFVQIHQLLSEPPQSCMLVVNYPPWTEHFTLEACQSTQKGDIHSQVTNKGYPAPPKKTFSCTFYSSASYRRIWNSTPVYIMKASENKLRQKWGNGLNEKTLSGTFKCMFFKHTNKEMSWWIRFNKKLWLSFQEI